MHLLNAPSNAIELLLFIIIIAVVMFSFSRAKHFSCQLIATVDHSLQTPMGGCFNHIIHDNKYNIIICKQNHKTGKHQSRTRWGQWILFTFPKGTWCIMVYNVYLITLVCNGAQTCLQYYRSDMMCMPDLN